MSEVELENEKNYKLFKIITIVIVYFIIGLFIIFLVGVSKVNASTYASVYDKDDVTIEYNGSTSGSTSTTFGCLLGNCGTFTNTNGFGLSVIFDGTFKSGTTYNFEVQFTAKQRPSNNPTTWAMGAIVMLGNRAGTTLSVSNRSWRRISSSYSDDSIGTAIYNFTGSVTPSSNGTKLTFMFPNNTSYSSLGVMNYNYISVSISSTNTDKTNADIINNNNSNTTNIINNNNSNTDRIIESNSETKESVEDVNDTLNDESIADLNNIQVTTADDSAISDLLLLPITLANIIINADSGSCLDYTIGELFGHTLKFRCIDFENLLGSNLYHTIDIFMAFFMIYEVVKMIITAFNDITSLRDSFDDLYTPAHQGYATKHGGGERV